MNYPLRILTESEPLPSIEKLLGMEEKPSEDVMDQADTISLQELSRRERRRG